MDQSFLRALALDDVGEHIQRGLDQLAVGVVEAHVVARILGQVAEDQRETRGGVVGPRQEWRTHEVLDLARHRTDRGVGVDEIELGNRREIMA